MLNLNFGHLLVDEESWCELLNIPTKSRCTMSTYLEVWPSVFAVGWNLPERPCLSVLMLLNTLPWPFCSILRSELISPYWYRWLGIWLWYSEGWLPCDLSRTTTWLKFSLETKLSSSLEDTALLCKLPVLCCLYWGLIALRFSPRRNFLDFPFLLDYLPELTFLSFLASFLESVSDRVLDFMGLLKICV